MTIITEAPPGITVIEPGTDGYAVVLRKMGVTPPGGEATDSQLLEYDQRTRSVIMPAFLLVIGSLMGYMIFGRPDEEDMSVFFVIVALCLFGIFMYCIVRLLHDAFNRRRWFLLSRGGLTVLHHVLLEHFPIVSHVEAEEMSGIVLADWEENATVKTVRLRLADGSLRTLVSDTSPERARFLHNVLKRLYCDDIQTD